MSGGNRRKTKRRSKRREELPEAAPFGGMYGLLVNAGDASTVRHYDLRDFLPIGLYNTSGIARANSSLRSDIVMYGAGSKKILAVA